MPTNLYGPGDKFHPAVSHVIPALIKKCVDAVEAGDDHIEVWGTGAASREFLYVDDAADGLVFLMQHYTGEGFLNLGTGTEISIADLAELVCRTVGFQGRIRFDHSRPDGTPRKVMDVSRLSALGWHAGTSLQQGLQQTYRWYLEQFASDRRSAVASVA